MKPVKGKWIRGDLLYETDKSTLLAGDDFMLEGNYEKGPKRNENTFLYITANGRYFDVRQVAMSASIVSNATALTASEAMALWSNLDNQRVTFEEAFPGADIKEA